MGVEAPRVGGGGGGASRRARAVSFFPAGSLAHAPRPPAPRSEIQATNDETDRKLHYRRQLEHMYRRLQSNGIKFDAHINQMEDALAASEREYKDVKILMRQLEAGKTTALHELHELQRQVDIERGDRERVFLVRQTEANNAKKMEVWRKEREIMRKEFASELKGDLSLEEEQALKQKLTHHQRLTEDLRAQNEQLQRDASELEHAFTQIRQATGVNSLDEMVEKFVGQEGNRKALQTEKAEAEARLTNAKHAKEETEARFTELKASGIGSTEMNREIADKLEGEITAAKHELKVSKAACERLEAVLVALRQGVVGLYQRLRPFSGLLEGEGVAAAILPSQMGAGGGAGGGASTDVSQIDSLDAVHLSEIVLSKMVELIGGGDVGGGAGGAKFGAVAEAEVAKEDEAFGDPLDVTDGLPNPRNNIRVKNGKELRLAEDTMAQFALEADGESSVRGGGAEHDAAEAHEPPPDDPLAVVEDMVLTRDFLKLSSSRQHSEKLRSMEQDSRRRKLMERMETADESERQLMQGRAARKRAQGEANKRLSSAPSHASTNKPLSVKESAVERAQMFLTAVPDLA